MTSRVCLSRIRGALSALGGVVLFVVAASALPAAASSNATIALSSSTPSSGAGVQLSARVDGVGSAPLAGTKVNFYVHLEEFAAAPELLVGSASTNASGVATIVYQPTWPGTQRFAATATDATGAVLATAALTVTAAQTDPFAGPVQSLRPDGLIGRWVVVVLLALVIGVWITLLALVVRVQQGPAPTVH